MIEDYEGIQNALKVGDTSKEGLSNSEKDYLSECIDNPNTEILVDRIDELSDYVPPKAIDSNPEVAEIIEPVKENIDSKYLEAPSDLEQIEGIGEYLSGVEDLRYENWENLSYDERYRALQEAEIEIAKIEHREFCGIDLEKMPPGQMGYYNPDTQRITLNEYYVMENSPESLKETLDTLIHEGRHAYQDYNMTQREVHPREGEVNMWKWNQYEIGYQSPDPLWEGLEAYFMQPVETDARAFAEDVLKNYHERIA